jgi:hypothetical protein
MARKRDLESGERPPAPLPVDLAGPPDDLRGCAQWVLWKYARRTDQRGKHRFPDPLDGRP